MTADKFLEQYQNITIEIKNIETEMEEMMSDAIPVRSTSDIDGMPHGTNIGDPTGNIAVELADKLTERRKKLADRILRRVDIRAKVFDAIMQLDGVEQEALYAKYILLKDEQGIMDYIHYERSMMYEYVRRGVTQIQLLIDSGRLRT